MNYDPAAHRVDCELPQGSADVSTRPGYRVYPQPSDFTVSLDGAVPVNMPWGEQHPLDDATIAALIVNPKPEADANGRRRWQGWAPKCALPQQQQQQLANWLNTALLCAAL